MASSLTDSAAGRLFGVFWGSLVVIDLAGLTHLPFAVATGGVVLMVGVACWRQGTMTPLAAAGMGWMFVNGFLVNRLGQLGWDGFPDFWRLLLVTTVALLAGRPGGLDGFLARAARWRAPARVRSQAGPSDARERVGRERNPVGR